jgi:hypothetical protein
LTVVLETELLPLAEPDSEPISLAAGLQTTISTLFFKHSPSSVIDCPSFASHTAVHGNGMPIALNSPLEQHAYMSQKAWSLTSAALLMAHPPWEPVGCAGALDLAEQPGALPKEKTEGMAVGVVKDEGDAFV